MDFWQVHGWLFLVAVSFFPRLTMLFAVSAPFGLLAWVGWLFVPHVTVAVLATGLSGCASHPSNCTNVPGAVIGGVAGGILGSAVGGGTGRDIAIGAGAATGAVVGSNYGC